MGGRRVAGMLAISSSMARACFAFALVAAAVQLRRLRGKSHSKNIILCESCDFLFARNFQIHA
jgi:hypothetical protein